MWIKISSSKGFSTVEAIVSLGFLIILIFFSWQMLEKQKEIVIKSNQDVELTSIVFDIRQALRGDSCTQNFSGLSLDSDKINSIRMYAKDSQDITTLYPTDENSEEVTSETGIKVSSYRLDPIGKNNRRREGMTYLKIVFDRGQKLGKVVREIKIYTKIKDYSISKCSLNPFSEGKDLWKEQGNRLLTQMKSLQINSEKNIGTLNIKGGVFVHKSVIPCSRDQRGMIFWNASENRWEICKERGEVSLEDRRVFTLSNLKKMESDER